MKPSIPSTMRNVIMAALGIYALMPMGTHAEQLIRATSNSSELGSFQDYRSQPSFTPTQTINGLGDDQDTGTYTLAYGCEFQNKFYVEASYNNLGTFTKYRQANANPLNSSTTKHEEKLQSVVLSVGRVFNITGPLDLDAQLGVHRYNRTIRESIEQRHTVSFVPFVGTVNVTDNTTYDTGYGSVAVVRLVFNLGKNVAFTMGASQYNAIDVFTTDFGVKVKF